MNRELSDMRIDYQLGYLELTDLPENPFSAFEAWFEAAKLAGVKEPNAMALATVNDVGQPAARMVLLKNIDTRGFVFFTNFESRKGRDLSTEPHKVALLFFWQEMERQVRIEGSVEPISDWESDAYYQSRNRESQIGAWASPQSQVIHNRAELEYKVKTISDKYEGQESLPRPPFWGGYRVIPHQIEFWQGRASRLHDRVLYTLSAEGSWEKVRLAP